MIKGVLYIGNDLSKRSGYVTTMDTLSSYLVKEGYCVFKTSGKQNKIQRLLDMCWTILKYRNKVSYILIDTFSTTNFFYALFTSQIARLIKLPYIPILHGGNLPHRLDKNPYLSELIFKNSYKNIAPSNYLKNEFLLRKFKVEFIPNVLELDNLIFEDRQQIKPKFLWVRSFHNLYNPQLAVEVLYRIIQKYPEAKLCMVGPKKDDSFDSVSNLVTRYHLNDHVEFTGLLPKQEWYEKSKEYDFFINTTNFDNTPISVMEAMGLGLTIVSTDAGGMPFLIESGVDGILVEKDNANAMASAILKILETNNLSYMMNSRQKVETFSWPFVREKWISILK